MPLASSRGTSHPVFSQSLAALTGIDAGAGPFATGDVAWLHRIWQVPLWALDDDDLVLLVGRGKGMPYVAALACDRLMEDPLRGGRSGPGALLLVVAALPDAVFAVDPNLADSLARCVQRAQELLANGGDDRTADRSAILEDELALAAERAAAMSKPT